MPTLQGMSAQAFDAEHGEFIIRDNHLIFEDGAARENSVPAMLFDPPSDEHECAKRIVLFHKIRLERAVTEFDDLKRGLTKFTKRNLGDRRVPGPPPFEQLNELKRLRTIVRDRQEALQHAEAQVEATIPKEQLAREKQRAERRAENENFLGQLEQIQI